MSKFKKIRQYVGNEDDEIELPELDPDKVAAFTAAFTGQSADEKKKRGNDGRKLKN